MHCRALSLLVQAGSFTEPGGSAWNTSLRSHCILGFLSWHSPTTPHFTVSLGPWLTRLLHKMHGWAD